MTSCTWLPVSAVAAAPAALAEVWVNTAALAPQAKRISLEGLLFGSRAPLKSVCII